MGGYLSNGHGKVGKLPDDVAPLRSAEAGCNRSRFRQRFAALLPKREHFAPSALGTAPFGTSERARQQAKTTGKY